ncbi:MAG: PIG-L deacetylase family protein [Planctomycetota bacterium]
MTEDLSSTFNVRRVAAVGAHPDDVEIGCLGTLMKLGPDVETHVFVGCLGSPGDSTTSTARVGETRAAFQHLTSLKTLDIRERPGITPTDFENVLKQLQALLEIAKPQLILSHGPKDTHQEHRLMWEICLAAARRQPASILHYGTASSTADFSPNVFVDIATLYEAKKAALAEHKSQADKDYMNEPHLGICHSNTYASLHGVRCSEAFELFRGFL